MASLADRHRPSAQPRDPAPPQTGGGPRRVVVAVDDSPSAIHAALYAAGLARRNGATLLFVHVCRPPIIWPDLGIAMADYLDARTHPSPEVIALASSIS